MRAHGINHRAGFSRAGRFRPSATLIAVTAVVAAFLIGIPSSYAASPPVITAGNWYSSSTSAGAGAQTFGASVTVSGSGQYIVGASVTWTGAQSVSFDPSACGMNIDGTLSSPGGPARGTALAPTCYSSAATTGVNVERFCLASNYLIPDAANHKLNFYGGWTVPAQPVTGSPNVSWIYSTTQSSGCSATNAGTTKVTSTTLAGQTTYYGNPPSITPTAAGSTNNTGSVTVSFSATSNPGDPSTYVVNSHDLTTNTYSNDVCVNNHGPATGTQTCVTAGTVGHSYQFQVVASNSYGTTTGLWSSSATPAAVSSAPTLNSAIPTGSGTVTLAWSAPATMNGATINTYSASATDAAGGATTTWSGISSAATSYTTAALTGGHTYSFKITANENTTPASVDSNVISGVVVTAPPGVPTGVTATAGNNQGTISWTAPANTGGSPISSYTLAVTNTFTSVITTITGVAASPYIVTGLTNGQNESVKVAAVNAQGTGSYSTAATFIPTGPPTAGPSSITANAGNAQASFSWTRLTTAEQNGSTVTGYTVTLADQTTAANGGQTCSTANAGTTTCTATGLTNGDSYIATVIANTNYGPSPATSSSAFVPAGPPLTPAAPVATVNALDITVTWAPPANNGSAITGYTVFYAGGASACSTTTATSCAISTQAGTWGTSYTFTVTATNGVGISPNSPASNQVTTYTTPLAPTAPAGSQLPTGAHVTWTAPNNRGSTITSYTVTATDTTALAGGAAQRAAIAPIITGGGTLSADFANLTAGDSYTFTVAATNAAGTGATSPASAPVTPYGPPSQMTAPTVASVGDTTATISWTTPGLNFYVGTPSYTVTASDSTNAGRGGQTCSSTAASCVLTGLTDGDSYTVTVVAVDPAGTSPASPASAAFTPTGAPGAPGAPGATADGANTAQVSLGTAAAANGAPVTRYSISFTDTDTSAAGPACTITLPATSCTATQLVAGDSYIFKAAATNAVGTGGYGPASTPVTAYGAPVPPVAPTASAGVKTATVSWAAATTQGTPTTGYRVLAVDSTSSNRGGQTCAVDGVTLSCAVAGLTAGDSYTFKLAATNIVGTSDYGPASNAVVPYDVAPPPTGVTVVAGDGVATVTWTAPASDSGSRITSYNVTIIDSTNSARGGQTCTTAGTNCAVTGLTDGDSYYAVVVATNAAGPSTSAASPAFTPNGLPTPPTSITSIAGAGQVALTWTQADGRGAAVTSYTVTATDQTVPAHGGQTCAVTSTACTITGLTVNDSYVFTVTATNANGTSGPSPASAPVKPYARPSGLTAPSATAGAGKAVVSWSAPDANSNPITGYTVTALDLTTPANGGQTCSSTLGTTCTVTGLTAGDSYTFSYTATNNAGDSDPSAPSNAVLVYTVPVAPASVSATAGDHQVAITWAPPTFTGGSAITSYTVRLVDTTTPANGDQSYSTPDASIHSYAFTGLINGDSYTASVTASNAGGTGNATDSLPFTPFGIPAAPAAPTAALSGPGRIAVSWTAPDANGSPITGYAVAATDVDDPAGNPPACATGGAVTCSIGGLTGGHHYRFTVTAANAAGTSAPSPASSAVLAIDAPTRPATITANSGNRSITASWTAPADTHGAPVSGYTVAARIVGDEHSYTTDGSTLSHTFTGLQAGQVYSVSVVATNAVGDSPPSSATAMPYDAPSAPRSVTAVRGPNQVILSWLPPTQTYGLTGISYDVALVDSDTAANGGQTCSGIAATSCTITGLTNGEHYTATVTATDLGGTSSPADSPVFIPMDSPAAPAAVTAAAARLAATVTWTAPADNGSPITGYTVTAADQSAPANGGQACSATGTTCTVTGLTVGDSYTFTVTATNAAGDSVASAASNVVRPYDVPGAPAAPRGTPLKGGASISWTALNSTNGSPITRYTVTAADLTDPAHGGQTCTAAGSGISCSMSDLTPGETYTFTLVATNAAGDSPASPASAGVVPRSTTNAPTNIRIATGDSTATLSWTAPAAPDNQITGYAVALSDFTSVARGGQTCSTTTETTCTITGLTNGDSYTVTVTASSAGGDASAAAGPFNTYGAPGAPGAPNAVAGAGQATVSWAASDPNGYISQGQRITYIVTAFDTDNAAHGGQTCASPSATTCTVRSLTAGEHYTFTVVAANDRQSSPASSATALVMPFALPARPGTVTAVGGNASATVEWTVPPTDGYSAILSYTVLLEDSTVPDHGGQTFTTANASTLTHTFADLTNGELYRATVYATNAAGDGLATASDFFTPSGAPDRPDAPVATQTGPRSISVSWTMPPQNASAITGYTLIYATGGTGTACTATADARGCTVDNLNAGSYSFILRAVNAQGESQPSAASNVIVLGVDCTATPTADGCGSVIVDGSISLTLDTGDQSFTLAGNAGQNAAGPDDSISYIVTTNNTAGYSVSVKADQADLLPVDTTTNTDKIPFSLVQATGTAYAPGVVAGGGSSVGGMVDLGTGGLVYQQTGRSAPDGDEHKTTFRAALPFVNDDTYRGTVTLTATAN